MLTHLLSLLSERVPYLLARADDHAQTPRRPPTNPNPNPDPDPNQTTMRNASAASQFRTLVVSDSPFGVVKKFLEEEAGTAK